MKPDEIKHFLVALDPATGRTEVTHFGNDYEAAQPPMLGLSGQTPTTTKGVTSCS